MTVFDFGRKLADAPWERVGVNMVAQIKFSQSDYAELLNQFPSTIGGEMSVLSGLCLVSNPLIPRGVVVLCDGGGKALEVWNFSEESDGQIG